MTTPEAKGTPVAGLEMTADVESYIQYGIRWHEYPDDPVELRDSLADAQDIAAIYKSQPLTIVQRTVTASPWGPAVTAADPDTKRRSVAPEVER